MLYWDKEVNGFNADALAPYNARPSAVMVLTMQVKQVLVFHKYGFQLPVPSEMAENTNIILCFLKQMQHYKGSH